MKGWFVCGPNHRENDKHKREEVSAAIKRLREKYVTALLKVAGLEEVLELGNNAHAGEGNGEDFNESRWAENDSKDDEVRMEIAYLATEYLRVTERAL